MVVVPEAEYENLCKWHAEKVLRNPIDNKIDETSANMSKTLRDDQMNVTEKAAAYDQELKRLRSLIRQKEESATATNLRSMLDQIVEQFGQLVASVKQPATLTTRPQPSASEIAQTMLP